jgi:hypothetical protein
MFSLGAGIGTLAAGWLIHALVRRIRTPWPG